LTAAPARAERCFERGGLRSSVDVVAGTAVVTGADADVETRATATPPGALSAPPPHPDNTQHNTSTATTTKPPTTRYRPTAINNYRDRAGGHL
jgi:hypothetical protein